jgi:hypothetical protein
MIHISYFTTAKILDKRSSPLRVEYRREFEPLWLPVELVKEVPMEVFASGVTRMDSYK